MSIRAFTVGVAALVLAVPAAAQQRGTMEFGAFASAASFDNALTLKSAFGGGGRVGMYLHPMWSIEFEDAEMRAKRTLGLRDVNVGILSGRLVASPRMGALTLLLGAGAGVSTETNFLHSYGVDALLGLKIALGDNAAFRVDGVLDWLANEEGTPPKAWRTYKSIRAGISLYRNPHRETRTVTVVTPAPPPTIIERQDTLSARLLREREAELRALRDSLANARRVSSEQVIPIGKDADGSMEARIQFPSGSATLSDAARALIDARIEMLRANPAVNIVVQGDNSALFTRRAQAAKDYLVSRGIAASRVSIESGRVDPSPTTFRLVIVS